MQSGRLRSFVTLMFFLRDWCSSWSADLTQKTNHHGIDDDDDDDNNKANMASLDFLLA